MAAQRRVHAQRQADDQRENRRHQRQLQRGGQAGLDQAGDLLALAQRNAEIALQGVADEAGELDRRRVVQAEALAQLDPLGVGGVLPQHDGDGIADVLEKHESQQGDGEHDRRGLQDAAQNECKHGNSIRGAAPPGAAPGTGRRRATSLAGLSRYAPSRPTGDCRPDGSPSRSCAWPRE
ncbi:Uncharacterised protein [Bordetella pertussis]|nr:Uncharacterised protein [Bordetella pertussis]